ncbi:MAG: nitroreductase family protein [Bacteroidales bacterium]|nr:nitroreductase family protein [Bacteroidales bacterium]
MTDFIELATKRYSVRDFAPTAIEEEKIDLILRAAQVAPTAVNYQPQKLYLVKSPEAMTRLQGIRPMFGAPAAVIVCYDDGLSWKNPRNNSHDGGEVDAAIVTTHMMLQAWELGIGSCWIGAFNPAELKGAFGIPVTEHPVAILALGYPSENCQPSDRHDKYREMSEMLKVL